MGSGVSRHTRTRVISVLLNNKMKYLLAYRGFHGLCAFATQSFDYCRPLEIPGQSTGTGHVSTGASARGRGSAARPQHRCGCLGIVPAQPAGWGEACQPIAHQARRHQTPPVAEGDGRTAPEWAWCGGRPAPREGRKGGGLVRRRRQGQGRGPLPRRRCRAIAAPA